MISATKSLWEQITIGRIPLENRLAVAPVARDRSTPEGVPVGMIVERLEIGAPLDEPERSTLCGGEERGCTDYPTLSDTIVAGDRAA